jgi:hypothetical protein
MGSSQSSTINECNAQLNKNILNSITQQGVSTSSVINNTNTLTVNAKGMIMGPNCNMNFNQTINTNQKIKQIAQLTTSQQITDVLNNAIKNTLTSNNSAVNKFISTTFSGQNSNINAVSYIQNVVDKNITDSQSSNVTNFVNNLNKGVLDLEGMNCNGNFNDPQDIAVNSVVSNLSTMVTNAIMSDSLLANGVNNLANLDSAKNEGLGDAIAGVFKSMNWMIVGIVVVLIALIFFVPKIINSLGGSQGISQIMQSAGPAAAAAFRRPQRRRINMF